MYFGKKGSWNGFSTFRLLVEAQSSLFEIHADQWMPYAFT